MNVSQFLRNLTEEERNSFRIPAKIPDLIFSFPRSQHSPLGSPISIGEKFHKDLENLFSGDWIAPWHYGGCLAVGAVLDAVGVELSAIQSETKFQRGRTVGIADFTGRMENRLLVGEVKTTMGKHLDPPNPKEVCQAALYAGLAGERDPILVFVRISFNRTKAAGWILDGAGYSASAEKLLN